jgi:hypothetical protein
MYEYKTPLAESILRDTACTVMNNPVGVAGVELDGPPAPAAAAPAPPAAAGARPLAAGALALALFLTAAI